MTVRDCIIEASKAESSSDFDTMFDDLSEGARLSGEYSENPYFISPDAFELYYMLGFYYYRVNPDQAYLCFKNALFHATEQEDIDTINDTVDQLFSAGDVSIHKTAIIIVSYNGRYFMERNIESIRNTLSEDSYEIIVIDNASTDGVADYLKSQSDIHFIQNSSNLGFSKACNKAVQYLIDNNMEDYDVFLLNNDTRLCHDSLFWLKMGLYENDSIGAAGAVSNYAGNDQQLDIEFDLPNKYLQNAKSINIPLTHPYEERIRLSGFAMLIKAGLWQSSGGMDEDFTPGYFEDDDISMKISKLGYRLLLCRNSFIYHAGSQSFSARKDISELLTDHHRLFIQKYNFDILKYAYPNRGLSNILPDSSDLQFNVLYVGCGLGADIKYLKSVYHNANIFGIEYNPALYDICFKTETVFPDYKSLFKLIDFPLFNYALFFGDSFSSLSSDDRKILLKICLPDCKIIQHTERFTAKYNYDFSKIKLIIWDLDNTFWSGILSEGSVNVDPSYVDLIRKLSDCGIINSISSKNDKSQVINVLGQLNISDLFVFNNINWENKGEQIQQKINDMGLRSVNVLFIDDDNRNLEEAAFYCPDIMTAKPDIIPLLEWYSESVPAKDPEHKRLNSYRDMEVRVAQLHKAVNREAFLYDSRIKVNIINGSDACIKKIERISELVMRTNQLNYTKKRDSLSTLEEYISDEAIDKGYIEVSDKYGNYGIVGFFCLEKGNIYLRHFLFSCRIIGMGVQNYVYSKIGCPQITTVDPVAAPINTDSSSFEWINNDSDMNSADNSDHSASSNKIKVLLKGPCDMNAIGSYLIGGDLTCEFNYVNDLGFITTGQNHTMHIWEHSNCSAEDIATMSQTAPFITSGDFQTSIFDNEYDVICLSLLPDCHAGLYRNKSTGHYISFGSVNFDLTDPSYTEGYINGSIVNHAFPFTQSIIDTFRENWEFIGTTPEDLLLRNLDYIFKNVKGNPVFILLLGSEVEYLGDNDEFADHAWRHKRINAIIRSHYDGNDNIKLINTSKYIHSQDGYEDCINHFSRNVYYNIATDIVTIINQKVLQIKSTSSRTDNTAYNTLYEKGIEYKNRIEGTDSKLLPVKNEFELLKKKHYDSGLIGSTEALTEMYTLFTEYQKKLNSIFERVNFSKLGHHSFINENPFTGRAVVYTVITGKYDELKVPEYINSEYDYICLTDNHELSSDFWSIRYIDDNDGLDNVKRARKAKILCSEIFPEYDYSVYIDGKLQIIGDMQTFISKYSTGRSLIGFPHHLRDDISDELSELILLRKDDEKVMVSQVNRYIAEGFPSHYGLTDTACLIRSHHDSNLNNVMNDWWHEVSSNSRRDQLSFTYCCWKNGFEIDLCSNSVINNKYVIPFEHAK